MGLPLRAGQLLLGAAAVGAAVPSCYSAGGGTAPPPETFYFPVGLAVSSDGNVLYAVNSDFDLQYNGGTLQSYDLSSLRRDAVNQVTAAIANIGNDAGCPSQQPPGGTPLGQLCAPPTSTTPHYFKKSVTIGAFASAMQISKISDPTIPTRTRLFVAVRGDATLTWADIGDPDDPFKIDCGQASGTRCDAAHQAGNDPNALGDTRNATMPGEPFGMAQTEDGTAIAITHQTDTKTSLLTTQPLPTMQFVLDGVPTGGVGIAAVPHDPDAPVKPCENVNDTPPCVRPAFLETSRTTAEIDLLRYYDDDGTSFDGGLPPGTSSLHRPFLSREAAYPITSNSIGTDSRGIVIDRTPRIACKASGLDPASCATQYPARVFFASRTPPALGIGEIGGPPSIGAMYDPDRLVLTGNVPLPNGPSSVYLAPIVDPTGVFALRVFIVCFDQSQIVVYDPNAQAVENVINVGPGPFAMAFDPFLIEDVGRQAPVPKDDLGTRKYRFAYVASFTQSFVQMIDLDDSQSSPETFERVVFTLGQPTNPKGR
jgi:hypothetical protein